jgi:hypothetical protein
MRPDYVCTCSSTTLHDDGALKASCPAGEVRGEVKIYKYLNIFNNLKIPNNATPLTQPLITLIITPIKR